MISLSYANEADATHENLVEYVRKLGRKEPIAAMYCTEHGSKKGRVHHHALIFSNHLTDQIIRRTERPVVKSKMPVKEETKKARREARNR